MKGQVGFEAVSLLLHCDCVVSMVIETFHGSAD